ncbi:hypothetical protein JW935_15885 [candidate division KSB1 bacterium]|nr:hypothetical protein [candidate division KSB1 bacterium]
MKNLMLIIFFPLLVFGQFKSSSDRLDIASSLRNSVGIGRQAMGLVGLDPSRLHIDQSYSVGYMSAGGKGFTQGVYLNTMTYDFKAPLKVALQWGIAHQPTFGMNDTTPMMNNGPFVSGALLQYKPLKNVSIELNYQAVPYSQYMFYRNRMGW